MVFSFPHSLFSRILFELSFAINFGLTPIPSICPRDCKFKSPSSLKKTENLILDDPAFMTNIASFIPFPLLQLEAYTLPKASSFLLRSLLLCATKTANAADVFLALGLSALLVSTIGTLAPRTIPAVAAPAK